MEFYEPSLHRYKWMRELSTHSYLIVILTNINKLMINVRRMLKNKKTIKKNFKQIPYSIRDNVKCIILLG